MQKSREWQEGYEMGYSHAAEMGYGKPEVATKEDALDYIRMLNETFAETGQELLDESKAGDFLRGYREGWKEGNRE